MFAAAPADCPPATQDIELNLKNRKSAIDSAMYGPLNPAEPNDEYWQTLGAEWNVDADTARQQTCGNCAMFNVGENMKACIAAGVGPDNFDQVDAAGELGYCEAFDFKCASARTCRAWVTGGPVTAAAKKSGASTPAPKKDRVKGSKKNKKGSASGEGKITFSKSVEESLKNKVAEHNKKAKSGRKATLSMLKAVYRRGAGAYSTSHRPGKTRGQWAMARVNAYLRLLSSGSPKNSSYTQDNDLLPASHPKSTRSSAAIAASAVDYNTQALEEVSGFAEGELRIEVKRPDEYESSEAAILALTELSGLGYEAEAAVRASWLRAVSEGEESPFRRAENFAIMKRSSRDADLLPEEGEL
jgi:hypothetical protein